MELIIYKELIGKTFKSIKNVDDEQMTFDSDYVFYHGQCCCESVRIEEIVGDLSDLENSPILQAEETTEEKDTEWGSSTMTFYKFATIKGSVTVRWLGESNGYYSESVDFGTFKERDRWL